MSVREQIINVVAEISGLDAKEVDTSKSLADLGCDSLDITEASINIEDDTGVTIPNEVWEGFKTVDEIIAFIESKV